MFRWGNPSLRGWVRRAERGKLGIETTPATYGGVVRHTILMCVLTIVTAIAVEAIMWFAILKPEVALGNLDYWMFGLICLGVLSIAWLIMHFVILFSPTSANVLGPICCAIQGLFLGFSAFIFDIFVPGISLAALVGTGIVFLFVLFLYKRMEVRIKSSFFRIFIVFMLSYFVAQLAMLIACIVMDVWAMFWIEAFTSLLFIGMACFTVMWDIQNIDTLVKSGVDQSYEWPVAYALTTGLIYLYIQILELLFRIVILFSNSKGRK